MLTPFWALCRVTVIGFDLVVLYFLGGKSLVYLLMGTIYAGGLHPMGGSLIAEHYMFLTVSHAVAKHVLLGSHASSPSVFYAWCIALHMLTYAHCFICPPVLCSFCSCSTSKVSMALVQALAGKGCTIAGLRLLLPPVLLCTSSAPVNVRRRAKLNQYSEILV